ncbi:MAG: adenosylcobinamide-GDP ribazoletransferase, partial [Pseudomonadota bacterium]
GRSAEQALEIMRDSRIGAHGAVALILAFAARITLLAALSPLAAAGALALGMAIGRAAILPVVALERPARPDGLARLIARPDGGHGFYPRDILALAATLALAVGMAGIAGVLALGLGASCALLVGRFARARLGGITGDVLGAAAVLAEIAAIAALVGLR